MKTLQELTGEAIELLKQLIETPSFSGEEGETALLIEKWFVDHTITYKRNRHNVWAVNKHFDASKPTVLLNSHHDTVKPNNGYTKDPLKSIVEGEKLYGLGSNEVSIVGEPTLMNVAVAEKGLVVFDAEVKGRPSHAAHINSNNAIYNTIPVLKWFQDFKFEKTSDTLGDVKMTVTQIHAGKQHNAVPAHVKLVIDVRVNDRYSNQDIVAILQEHAPCDKITPRGLKLNSSSIPIEHELVQAGIALGRKTYGSPTLSDQATLTCPSLKLGPGDSARSHSADEFIYIHEIKEGIKIYIDLLNKVIV